MATCEGYEGWSSASVDVHIPLLFYIKNCYVSAPIHAREGFALAY